MPDRPRLVPELICSDLRRSLRFYTGVLGFRVRHERPAERFAHRVRQFALADPDSYVIRLSQRVGTRQR